MEKEERYCEACKWREGEIGYWSPCPEHKTMPPNKYKEVSENIDKNIELAHNKADKDFMPNDTRGRIEKVLWKHYDPDSSMNAEEIMDDIMPIVDEAHAQGRKEARKELAEKIPDILLRNSQEHYFGSIGDLFNNTSSSLSKINALLTEEGE